MNKLFLTFAFAVCAMAMNAQLYVGGEVGAWRDWDANHTTFFVQPEVGYNLNDQWAVGLELGYMNNYDNGAKENVFGLAPYARYTFAKFGSVNLFVDGGLAYYASDAAGDPKSFQIGVKPGVAVNLTEKLSFVSHVGFLGYRDSDLLGQASGLGFNLDGQDLSFGLYLNF